MPRGKIKDKEKALQRERAKQKGPRTKRGELSPIGERFIGRKGKSAEFANPGRCDYMIGGKRVFVKRRRTKHPYDIYLLGVIVGGKRCEKPTAIKTRNKERCVKHSGLDYKDEERDAE